VKNNTTAAAGKMGSNFMDRIQLQRCSGVTRIEYYGS
jgi:hypothetical protein